MNVHTWLDRVIDVENNDVPKHLGQIAEKMREWEGKIAEELELSPADVAAITMKHCSELKLQTYDLYGRHGHCACMVDTDIKQE